MALARSPRALQVLLRSPKSDTTKMPPAAENRHGRHGARRLTPCNFPWKPASQLHSNPNCLAHFTFHLGHRRKDPMLQSKNNAHNLDHTKKDELERIFTTPKAAASPPSYYHYSEQLSWWLGDREGDACHTRSSGVRGRGRPGVQL